MGELAPGAAAARYAACGLAVVPFHWIAGPGRCSCGCESPTCTRRGKHPVLPVLEPSTDLATVGEWWERWPEANVLVSARASGLIVLDIDEKPSARDALRTVTRRYGRSVLDTLRARSGGGGWHVFFAFPGGIQPVRKRPRVTRAYTATRGAIVWPSRHAGGGRYTWHGSDGPWDRPALAAPELLLRDLAASPGIGWYARNLPAVGAHYAQAIQRTARPLRRTRRA